MVSDLEAELMAIAAAEADRRAAEMPARVWAEPETGTTQCGDWVASPARLGPLHGAAYARIGGYARTVGDDGMPEAGREVLLQKLAGCRFVLAYTTGNARREWVWGDLTTVGANHRPAEPHHRWCYLDDAAAVLFGPLDDGATAER